MNHIHISGLEAVKIILVVVVFLALARILAAKLHNTAFGKALAFILN